MPGHSSNIIASSTHTQTPTVRWVEYCPWVVSCKRNRLQRRPPVRVFSPIVSGKCVWGYLPLIQPRHSFLHELADLPTHWLADKLPDVSDHSRCSSNTTRIWARGCPSHGCCSHTCVRHYFWNCHDLGADTHRGDPSTSELLQYASKTFVGFYGHKYPLSVSIIREQVGPTRWHHTRADVPSTLAIQAKHRNGCDGEASAYQPPARIYMRMRFEYPMTDPPLVAARSSQPRPQSARGQSTPG